ncbi:MAG: MFS transporter [Desulfobacteraceae bacterium]|nr:MFS transporter [Desulfobacteraceae bacterium]
MLAMFRRGLFYTYLTIYLKHFLGLSVTTTALFATIPMIFNVVLQRYVWGVLSDKYQKRRSFIIWGELLAGVGTAAIWYFHLIPENKLVSGYVIIAGLSVIEIFWSMSNIGWTALISDMYKKGSRVSVMGKLESLGGVGRFLGILAGGLLYDKLGSSYPGWGFHEGALFFLSAGIMIISIFPMFLIPEGGIGKENEQESNQTLTGDFNSSIFFVFITAMALIHFGRNSIAVSLAQYLTLKSGLSLSSLVLSHVVNIKSIAIIIFGITSGWAARKIGNNDYLMIASIAAALSLVVLGVTDSLFWICIASFLMGFSEVAILASSYELASQLIPPDRRGTLFSVFNATLFLSWGIAGAFIAGPITDFLIATGKPETYAYKVSFNVAAGITIAGILMLIYLFRLLKTNSLENLK